ncbi:nuclear speckle splicing regulatory protein 1-like [Chenopodium quinoa]|nr:nuclear speckle splicing regulatory protein 1-like [Chenopodium quinoa]
MQSNKYGLQIRVPKSQQKQQQARPLPPKPLAFNDDDDDDVEKEISRQAFKNKSLKDVEDQYKKALEEDPSVFDYDGVYDDMKAKIVKPKAEDRQQRQPKYIQALMEKAKKREKEHEVVYERKLAKERSKDDHLYADKDKFVTGAYKRKLAEQAKWMEEERLRELREEKDNVTKKSDLTDFYFNLAKNVAFGAEEKSKKSGRGDKESAAATEELKRPEKEADINERAVGNPSTSSAVVSPSRLDDRLQGEAAVAPEVRPEPAANLAPSPPTSTEVIPPPPTDKPKQDHHKKSQEALAAAKERFLARKKAKMEL